jgi:hypothetical protein
MAVSFRSVFGNYNLHRLNGKKQESRELRYGLTILYKALPSNRQLYVRLFYNIWGCRLILDSNIRDGHCGRVILEPILQKALSRGVLIKPLLICSRP